MTTCQDCKDYRECDGLKPFYNYAEIRWCPYQCLWIILYSGTFMLGKWPVDPDNPHDNNSGRTNIQTEASYCKPITILAELEQRLERTGMSGKLLVAEVEAGRDFSNLSREARDALMYIKGFRRKRDSFAKWKKERNYRRTHTKRYARQKIEAIKGG